LEEWFASGLEHVKVNRGGAFGAKAGVAGRDGYVDLWGCGVVHMQDIREGNVSCRASLRPLGLST